MYREHPFNPFPPDKTARRVISIYRTTGIEKPDLALFVSLDSIGQSVFIPRIAPSGHFSYKLSISIERDKTHAFFVQYKNKTVRYCEILRFRILAIGQLICVIQRDDLYFIKIIEKGGFLVSKRPEINMQHNSCLFAAGGQQKNRSKDATSPSQNHPILLQSQ